MCTFLRLLCRTPCRAFVRTLAALRIFCLALISFWLCIICPYSWQAGLFFQDLTFNFYLCVCTCVCLVWMCMYRSVPYLCVCMCVCLYECACMSWCLIYVHVRVLACVDVHIWAMSLEVKEDTDFSRAGVIGGCGSPCGCWELKPWSSGRAATSTAPGSTHS